MRTPKGGEKTKHSLRLKSRGLVEAELTSVHYSNEHVAYR